MNPRIITTAFAIARTLSALADRLSHWALERREKRFEQRLLLAESGAKPFTDDELVYAARNRCRCGHGFAYPRDCGPRFAWACSAQLKCIADAGEHSPTLPFVFYEIKSEDQPSAHGQTTRGSVVPDPERPPVA
jgi:hypothetical protein